MRNFFGNISMKPLHPPNYRLGLLRLLFILTLSFYLISCPDPNGGGNDERGGVPGEAFYGRWKAPAAAGNMSDYSLEIGQNSFIFDFSITQSLSLDQPINTYFCVIRLDNITWTRATNTATTHGVTGFYGDYGGFFVGQNSNPSRLFPNGFTITGTRTATFDGRSTTDSRMPDGLFIALSADRQTLYVAESASVYNRAGGVNQDSLFTRATD